jgi:peptidoglycan/LPS O-acetylase OafA/YrhL
VPALDAVRGVAILLVVADHAGMPGMRRAGTAGVSVFFVLSGYLITGVLLKRPGWRTFYARRAARLLPALLFMLALFGTACLVMGSTVVIDHAPPVLLYVGNWWQIVTGQSLGCLSHTWSLAVEEQFYLVWPLVLWLTPRRWLPSVLFAVVAVSLVLRFTVGGEHAYAGTDTNAYALAAGALLAVMRVRAPRWSTLTGFAVIAAGVVVPSDAWAATCGAAGAVLLVAARDLPAPPWLRHCGDVSYGWYLWQYPIVGLLTSPGHPDIRAGLLGAAIGLGLAEVSLRLVERPVLRWSHDRGNRPVELVPLVRG